MSDNNKLHEAKTAQRDEFFTLYDDIQNEINAYIDFNPDTFRGKTVLCPCDDPEFSNFTKFFAQNFQRFGLKKLISTSYAPNAKMKKYGTYGQMSKIGGTDDEKYMSHGRIFTLEEKDLTDEINLNNLKWGYLNEDGDFRSEEVTRLRDEADIIVTNSPFSLFRELVRWTTDADKKFLIIGNQNAITYKGIFPLIRDNKMWIGHGFKGNVGYFSSSYKDYASAGNHKKGLIRISGVMWFTNLDHGRRHEPLRLMTTKDNLKYSKHKEIRENGYLHYDNYDAIDVPYTDAIPEDYAEEKIVSDNELKSLKKQGFDITYRAKRADGSNLININNPVMGVPITFLDKYCPEQFEIVSFRKGLDGKDLVFSRGGGNNCSTLLSYPYQKEIAGIMNNPQDTKVNGKSKYARVLIRKILNQ